MAIDTVVQKEALADAYASAAPYVSLNTADPGTTGANEAAGITRVAISWSTGDNTDGVQTGVAVLAVPAGVTVTHASLWSAATGGTYRDGAVLSQSYTGAGNYTVSLTYTQS